MQIDPKTDLELVRLFKAPPEKVWRCWTEPKLIELWFAPKPVVTRDVQIDLRPGGRFRTVMDVPEHGTFDSTGCILAVDPNRRLVWTDLMEGDYRPAANASLGFTAIIELSAEGTGTRYRAIALHKSDAQREEHEKMGFHEGWGTAAMQLDALAMTL
jgi:uncharacterized protein YndB with AHSA1/START domain